MPHQFFPKEMSHSQRPSYFDQFVATRTKPVSKMFSFLAKKANKATVLPLSIFTNLFHQRFPKHQFLELTLELLHQFYIAIEECVDNYKMFPGNQYLLSIKCMRCHNCILSKNQGIAELLLNVPTAILQHFEFLDIHEDNLDVQPMALPLMYSSDKACIASTHSFKESLDRNDDVLHGPYFCINVRNGEFKFCEAVKVDVSNVCAQQTKERNHKKNVSNTMSLVKVLFEDIILAITVWKKSKYEQLQVKDASDLHVTLFNTTKASNKGYPFCKHEGNHDQLMTEEIESLDLVKSWCLFIYPLLHNNRLALLSGVTSYVYDKSDTVMKPLLFGMGYTGDDQDAILEYLTWQKSNHIQIPSCSGPFTYQCKINGRAYAVISALHHPFQFTLGESSSMLTIYDNKGDSGSTVNHRKYFWSDNPHNDNQVQPLMTTLHQYKENMILLSTMYKIKKIVPKKNRRKFWIKCLMRNYEQGNNAIRKRYKTLFKDTVNHQYNFPASNELVMTLPYQFVDSLKSGVWQKLPSP
jgi:hypothetical protein